MKKEMEFDRIMSEIKAGLTDKADENIEYLNKQCEKYKDHKLGKEIIRECGRLIYDLVPEETRAKLNEIVENKSDSINKSLEEVKELLFQKELDKALPKIESLIEDIDNLNWFKDDSVSEYHDFEEYFEEVLYKEGFFPEKEVRRTPIPFTTIFHLYGYILFELKKYEEARKALEIGLAWNPVSFKILSEYIEIFKVTGDLENFFKYTINAFCIAYKPHEVARCFRNLGFYFIEKKLYSEAKAVYILSMQFDNSEQALAELYYLDDKTNNQIEKPPVEKVKEYSEKYGFPFGANLGILNLAFKHGKESLEKRSPTSARYFFSILYELTKDPEIKAAIDKLPVPESDK